MFKRIIMLGLSLAMAASVAPASQADSPDKSTGLVKQFAHANSREMSTTSRGRAGHVLPLARLANGQSARTWLAVEGEAFGLTAELTKGQDSVAFDSLVPQGFSMTVRPDGSAMVRDGDGRFASEIKRPWARDAKGRSLGTHYEVQGSTLIQHVDTAGATFPIVADPWLTTGWWYATGVYYVELSWSETWALKNALATRGVDGLSLVCAAVPLVGKPTCKYLLSYVLPDVKKTVNAAILAKKCYKVRIPALGGIQALPAYDSYYKTCIR